MPPIDRMLVLQRAMVTSILEGEGKASSAQRRGAFDNTGLAKPLKTLVDKVAFHAYMTTDEDINHARGAGLDEDQIFEIIVCAAVGQATRQYERARAALDAVKAKE